MLLKFLSLFSGCFNRNQINFISYEQSAIISGLGKQIGVAALPFSSNVKNSLP